MEWLLSLALLPVVLCGLMCVGGILLAVVGFRRGERGGAASGDQDSGAPERVTAQRG
jgi:hypothetical protein